MKRKLLFLSFAILLIINGFYSFGQSSAQANGLKGLLGKLEEKTTDSTKIFTLIELSRHFCYNNTDSAIYYAEQALKHARNVCDKSGEAWALNVLGIAYYVNGSYDVALSNYQKSQHIFKDLNNLNRIAWSLNNIGLIYMGQQRYNDAIETYKKLFNDLEFGKDSTLQATALFNIAVCYDLNGEHEVAIPYLEKALAMSISIDNKRLRNLTINRMGEANMHLKNFDKAKVLYNQVLSSEDYQNNWELSFSHAGLAQCYLAEGYTKMAILHGQKSADLALLIDAKWDAAKAYKIITDAHAEDGNFKEAYRNHVLYEAYKDSLYSEAKEREVNYALLKLAEAEKGELKNLAELQEQKLNFNRTVNYGIAGASFLLSWLGFILYKNARQRDKLNRALLNKNADIAKQKDLITQQKDYLESLNKTKDRLFSIISHDLKSPLASIAGTLEIIRLGTLKKTDQEVIFKSLHSKVLLVSQMLHNLLYWANAQQMGIKTKPSRIKVLPSVERVLAVAELIAEEKGVRLIHKAQQLNDILADEDHFLIILQNLIGNSIKFTPTGGTVTVSYECQDDLQMITIKDSGIGIPEDKIEKLFNVVGSEITNTGTNKEGGTGIGLMLVQQFIKANHGTLEVKSEVDKGTEMKVVFPVYKEEAITENT